MSPAIPRISNLDARRHGSLRRKERRNRRRLFGQRWGCCTLDESAVAGAGSCLRGAAGPRNLGDVAYILPQPCARATASSVWLTMVSHTFPPTPCQVRREGTPLLQPSWFDNWTAFFACPAGSRVCLEIGEPGKLMVVHWFPFEYPLRT